MSRRPPRGPLVRAAWVLLPALALLAGVELLIAVLGPHALGASASFSDGALVDRDEDAGGAWVRFAGEPPHAVFVPDPTGARRVVLLGGSGTQGFPEDVLARELAAATPARDELGPAPSPDRGWEVLNLGRAGYGSWRVRRVLEQALPLEPDAVVLYCGHNEFVEAGFARERFGEVRAGAELSPRWYERLGTFRLLASWFRRAHADPEPAAGRLVRPVEPDTVRDWVTSYAQTKDVYARYSENLDAMVAAARAAGARVLLCTVIGNDFAGPRRSRCEAGADEARFDALVGEAAALLPPRVVAAFARGVRLDGIDWGLGLDASRVQQSPRVLPADYAPPPLRPLLGAFAPAPATTGSKQASVAGAHWTDPARWSADVPIVLDMYAAIVARDVDEVERARLARAAGLLEEALAVCPERAHGLWLLGLVRYLLGDVPIARELLARAHRFDWAPSRGNDVTNGIVRDLVARARDPGMRLLDLDALARTRCPDGLLGYEILLDECHLHPGVRPIIMADIAAALAAWDD